MHTISTSQDRYIFRSCKYGSSPHESCSRPRGENDSHFIVIFLLVFHLFDDVRLFTIDCASHVRLLSHFHETTIFPDQTFIVIASIAIWNKNKVATAMAISLWTAHVAFFIYCKLLLPCYTGYRALTRTWFVTVVACVNISSRLP